MKTTLRRILPAMLACSCAFGASAQDTTAAEVDAEAQAKAAQSTEDANNLTRIADRHCLRATGSRIVAMQNARADEADKHCAVEPGRVHTSEDLQHTGASTLGEALRRLERNPPDLIILDLWMPVMNGWQFLERLRAMGSPLADVPVIAVSADVRAGDGDLPVQAFMPKPMDMDHLLTTVREQLNGG